MQRDWEGLSNACHLSGIALKNGGRSRAGAYARSDHPLMLSPCGWEQLAEYGIRTIVSLETAGLEGENALRANRPVVTPEELDITLMQLPIEDGADEQFIDRWARSDSVGDGRGGWPVVARSRGNRILARRDQSTSGDTAPFDLISPQARTAEVQVNNP